MKKFLALILTVMMAVSMTAFAGAEQLANPWVETTQEGILENLGYTFNLPEGAEVTCVQMIPEEGLAEVQFTWEGAEMCLRMACTDEDADISGMYYSWTRSDAVTIGSCDGTLLLAEEDGKTIELCTWYDSISNMRYSLSAIAADLDGFDLTAIAEAVYVPMQSEITEPLFAELDGIVFEFSSGVGGWGTEMMINSFGSFYGEFHDSEMGESGENYPNGSYYYCEFIGNLSVAEQRNETTWRLNLDVLMPIADEESIEDGIRYVPVEKPYGLENCEELYLYTPGTPIEDLPEGFLPWAHLADMGMENDVELSYYALYNAEDQCGFVGIPEYEE